MRLVAYENLRAELLAQSDEEGGGGDNLFKEYGTVLYCVSLSFVSSVMLSFLFACIIDMFAFRMCAIIPQCVLRSIIGTASTAHHYGQYH